MTTKKAEKIDLEKEMKGKTRCSDCGRILSSSLNFYVSNSIINKHTGRLTLCKDCLVKFLVSLLEENGDVRTSIYKLCRRLDFVYLDNIYESSLAEAGWNKSLSIVQNGIEVWKKYIKTINSLTNYKGFTFECGDQIISNTEEESEKKEIVVTQTKEVKLSEEELEKRVKDKQNKEDIIRIIGYDPFENEVAEDKSKMYAKLINMINEDTQDDELKMSAIISIIKGQNQESKINDVITSLSSDVKQIKDNIGLIKNLTDTKEKLNKSLLALAKDNRISDLYSGQKTVGANTLTGMIKKLKELNLDEAQVNLFDIQTSMGMLQTARMSNKAIVENLNFGDDDLLDMVKFQRGKLETYESEYNKLREENRKMKILCNLNNIDYEEEIFEAEYSESLEYNEAQIEKQEEELEKFDKLVEEVLPITTNEYMDKVINNKKENEK